MPPNELLELIEAGLDLRITLLFDNNASPIGFVCTAMFEGDVLEEVVPISPSSTTIEEAEA